MVCELSGRGQWSGSGWKSDLEVGSGVGSVAVADPGA